MLNHEPARIAHALTEAAKAIHSPTTLEETLTAIAIEAQRSIPGFDHVGISLLHRDGRIETMAGTRRPRESEAGSAGQSPEVR